ncbi:MAG: hypothetical protein EWM45_04775 [Rhodopseudomonas palustris]|nr:MAG: hypothetical protein EWM45_04775 [Rhodopseudomonas palustris]
MTTRGGWRHTPEAKAKIAERNRARWADPAERARVSEATKARMASPEVRQRIRDGMARAARTSDALDSLRQAWLATTPEVRKRFIEELFMPACSASAPTDGGSVG